jgi:DNA repair protein RadD
MANVWAALGKARLQQLIGEKVLERLETLLPTLRPDELNPDQIYSHAGLTQIFEAFAGAAMLEKRDFRLELFNSLPEKMVGALVSKVGIKATGLSFTEKVALLSKKPWSNPKVAEAIAEVLGLPEGLLPNRLEAPPTELLFEATERPYKTLKDYQTPVYHEALRRLEIERGRFIVQMPTGSGKTRTAMEIITSFMNDSPPGTTVLWLAHAEELCEQAYEAFRDVWPHVARGPARLVRCWGKGAKIPAPDGKSSFVIGSFQTLYAALSKEPAAYEALRQYIGLVVIDEAHKVLAPTYRQVTEALLGEETRVMGLTATPGRGADDEEQNTALAKFFFGEIVAIDAGEESVIDYLRSRKVLSETTYVPLESDS